MPLSEETCVVTVTYGDRSEHVRRLIDAVAANGVRQIFVVDNGSEEVSRQQLRRFSEQCADNSITILALAENRGSSAGYAAGLRHVVEQTSFPYVWCLDDDNVPESAALRSLLEAYQHLQGNARQPLCLVSLREAQPWLSRVAQGESEATVFLRRSSFCGFHMADALRHVWSKVWGRADQTGSLIDEPIPLRFSPYGGLWMPTSLIGEAGYPDEQLVLYHDDTEYTSRLVRHGARIFLVPSSRVTDAEPSWAQAKQYGDGFSRMLLSDEELRIFYNTRNKVYFETHVRENTKTLQTVNELAFWILLAVLSRIYRVPDRRRLIRRAVLDGKRAQLGQAAYPLANSTDQD